MNRSMLVTAVAAGLLGMTTVTPTAQGFWGKGQGDHRSSHKVSPYEKRYGRTYLRGFPENCAMLAERAYLTNDAYWRYAAARCKQSRYSYH